MHAKTWSFAWKTELVSAVTNLAAQVDPCIESLRELAAQYELDVPAPNFDQMRILEGLNELADLAEAHSLGFAMGRDVNGRLDRLKTLADEKSKLNQYIEKIGHGASAELLEKTPIEKLQAELSEAEKVGGKNTWPHGSSTDNSKKLAGRSSPTL